MGHYKSNLRDVEFNLFEVFGRDQVYGTGPFAEMDVDTAKNILSEIARLAENDLAASFVDADRNPPVFDPETNTAPIPETFKKSYQTFMDAEWWRLGIPEGIGGQVTPNSLVWAYAEQVLGSNPAIWMYSSGPAFAGVVHDEGTEEQQKVAQRMVEGLWGATMVLTEPDAGSDVGAGRTKAVKQEDGSWHIEGVKRFITSGEHDMSENIIHLVLARPEGGKPGTKGLGLYIVPKFDFDWETGELGERNGVYATNVEHKMGLKASNTCEMTFGAKHPAKGWLLGETVDGIRQMFKIIEFARMMVGTKAIATLSTGYLNALEYAKERVQGADLAQFMDKTAPRVTITHHPDVRRSLLTQKAYAEGMRALVLYTASVQDDMLAARLRGKIDTLYEGTTAIQGQDFFFRKIVKDGGQALTAVNEQITKFLATGEGGAELAAERDLLAKAAGDLEAIVGKLIADLSAVEADVKNMYKVGQNTTRLLLVSGDVVVGWLLLRQAAVALAKLEAGASEKDVPFYRGKVAAAKHFARTVLPTTAAQRQIAENVDNELMELAEEAF
ncbi:acyl-CoA dehydrogenase [Kitasatospora sp. NRRL B-11411]|uniref:acyl-CoA dehydrogenase n=1 Tax=Kitasatospora sp. NRRL B-11411 TaxID=1463822 RepID=UPI0004C397A9|nr:acyl-CoA dehydrogenase [Kitasatospora sp. NRRL B-11411]